MSSQIIGQFSFRELACIKCGNLLKMRAFLEVRKERPRVRVQCDTCGTSHALVQGGPNSLIRAPVEEDCD